MVVGEDARGRCGGEGEGVQYQRVFSLKTLLMYFLLERAGSVRDSDDVVGDGEAGTPFQSKCVILNFQDKKWLR